MSNIRRTVKRRVRPDRRHARPYVASLVRQLREAEDALLDALAGIEAGVYSDEVWRVQVTQIHTLRAECGRLRWAIFKAIGFNLDVLRRLTKRV